VCRERAWIDGNPAARRVASRRTDEPFGRLSVRWYQGGRLPDAGAAAHDVSARVSAEYAYAANFDKRAFALHEVLVGAGK